MAEICMNDCPMKCGWPAKIVAGIVTKQMMLQSDDKWHCVQCRLIEPNFYWILNVEDMRILMGKYAWQIAGPKYGEFDWLIKST